MDDGEAKCFLFLTALCLSRTNRDANLLRALGTIWKVPERSQAGALTMIPSLPTPPLDGSKRKNKSEDSSTTSSEDINMLERAELMAAEFRANLTPQAALEGFSVLLLLFLQGPPAPSQPKFKGPLKRFQASSGTTTTPVTNSSPDLSMIKFDARASVILRRLAFLLRIRLSTVSALEELAIFNLEQATKQMLLEEQQADSGRAREKQWVRGLKIGAAATAAGGLLAVTGGLAAPALATGLASLGLGAVATVTTTTTVAALLGAGGAGLGAYKMNRRTQGVQHFEFQSINDEQQEQEENLKGMTVYICVSGYLRAPGPDDGTPVGDRSGAETAPLLKEQQSQGSTRSNSSASSFRSFRQTSLRKTSSSDLSSSSSSPSKSPSKRRRRGKSAAHSPDFFAPWGAQPKHLFPEQILDRFYSVVAPQKRLLAPLLVQIYAGQEDQVMDELARRYNGIHPKKLCPTNQLRRNLLQGKNNDEAMVYHNLLNRASERLRAMNNDNTTTPSNNDNPKWQMSQATLTTLMDTERAWDASKRNVRYCHHMEEDGEEDTVEASKDDDKATPPTTPQAKSKEEIDDIIADLTQKFEEEVPEKDNKEEPPLDQDLIWALEEEKMKIRLKPTVESDKIDKRKRLDANTELGHEVYWWREKVARYGDQYTLVWEPNTLLNVGECVSNLLKESAAKGALGGLQFTALSAIVAAVALPVAITAVVSSLDNCWSMAVTAADEAGQHLADALMSDAHGNRPVVLIGYSVGGRVVASCLSALAKIASGGQDSEDIITVEDYDTVTGAASTSSGSRRNMNSNKSNKNPNNARISAKERKRRLRAATIVRDAIIIGAPVGTSTKKWTQRRSVVLGRLINVYSPNDWVLALLYRYKSWSVVSLSGLQKVQSKPSSLFSPVENYNVSKIVNGHGEYHCKMQEILAHIGIGDVDSERFHGDYFVTSSSNQ